MEINPGDIYQHFKGERYKVIGLAKHSETQEELVAYQHLDGDGQMWVRPIGMFSEEVEVDGRKIPRFKYIKE